MEFYNLHLNHNHHHHIILNYHILQIYQIQLHVLNIQTFYHYTIYEDQLKKYLLILLILLLFMIINLIFFKNQ
jgi:hypothetical protein